MQGQMAPAGETEEQRKEREEATYRHARFYTEEQHFNDQYNPKLMTQNSVYPSAADMVVDPAQPTILLDTGVSSISPPAPPKAKPDTGQFTFDTKSRSGVRSGE